MMTGAPIKNTAQGATNQEDSTRYIAGFLRRACRLSSHEEVQCALWRKIVPHRELATSIIGENRIASIQDYVQVARIPIRTHAAGHQAARTAVYEFPAARDCELERVCPTCGVQTISMTPSLLDPSIPACRTGQMSVSSPHGAGAPGLVDRKTTWLEHCCVRTVWPFTRNGRCSFW